MFSCRIENYTNDILTLTQNEDNFQLLSIEGLNPPNAQINTSAIAGMDGARFNSSKLNARNIVIYIKLRGNIEENRLRLYSFFVAKEWCRFYYKNGRMDIFVEGYVETIECDIFTNNEVMQISILCPDPYLKSVQEILDDISKTVKLFEFPFAIEYPYIEFSRIEDNRIVNVGSSFASGVIIDIDIYQPVNKIEILKTDTNEKFVLEYDFLTDDKVVINTNKGQKSVVLIRGDGKINLFTSIEKGSVFFQLKNGDNYFTYRIDNAKHDQDVMITIKHRNQYQGV